VSEVVRRSEVIAPEPATALVGLLGVAPPDLADGLPLGWHWLHLLERPAQCDLGIDGHPLRGAVPAPPGPGRRRLWAGGSVRSLGPLRVGERATRTSRVLSSAEKTGRSGRLTLVTVGHVIEQAGEVVVEERQDILYRDGGALPLAETGAGKAEEEPVGDGDWEVPVSPTLLFRFSALTYNSHRIHYDRDYARDVEGYPGLVVHGPLQALVMAEAARSRGVPTATGTTLDYRLVAPLFEDQGLVVSAVGDATELTTTVRDAAGRRTAQGRLTRH
jgi:3-methylfumaryl-CoA hydratase